MNYLLRVNRTWYTYIRIPLDLQPYFPSKVFKKSLHTTSKTLARKLLPPILYDIQQKFFHLRLGNGYMPQEKPSQRAIEIFKIRFGKNTSVHEIAQPGEPCIYGTPWKFKDDLWKIQAKLDMGYDEEADGYFHLNDAPLVGLPALYQQSAPAPAPVPIAIAAIPAPAPIPAITLQKAKELYLLDCAKPTRSKTKKVKAAGTIDAYGLAINKLVEFLGSDQILTSALPTDLYDFSVSLTDKGKGKEALKEVSANKRTAQLKGFFEFLQKNKYIAELPTMERLIEDPDGEDTDANIPYTNEQLNLIFNYLINNIPHPIRQRKTHLGLTYLLLGLIHTGFRISELLHCEVLVYNNVPVFNNKRKTKNIKLSIRFVPAHTRLIQSGFIRYFFNYDKPQVRTLSNYFKRILLKLKIKVIGVNNDYTIHSCRSTFDTKSHGRINPDKLRMRLMGHACKDMDARYVDQQPDDAEMYLDAVNKCVYDIDYARINEYVRSELKDLYR